MGRGHPLRDPLADGDGPANRPQHTDQNRQRREFLFPVFAPGRSNSADDLSHVSGRVEWHDGVSGQLCRRWDDVVLQA